MNLNFLKIIEDKLLFNRLSIEIKIIIKSVYGYLVEHETSHLCHLLLPLSEFFRRNFVLWEIVVLSLGRVVKSTGLHKINI